MNKSDRRELLEMLSKDLADLYGSFDFTLKQVEYKPWVSIADRQRMDSYSLLIELCEMRKTLFDLEVECCVATQNQELDSVRMEVFGLITQVKPVIDKLYGQYAVEPIPLAEYDTAIRKLSDKWEGVHLLLDRLQKRVNDLLAPVCQA